MEKAVLLLHGWLTDSNDFEKLLPHLKNHYQHIEKITYPGHGSQGNYYDFKADQTITLTEECFLKLKNSYPQVDVIGFSMGGALATYLACKYQVGRLVLISPANKYLNLRVPFSKAKNLIGNLFRYQKAKIMKDTESKEQLKALLHAIFEDDKICLQFLKNKYLKKYFRRAYINFREVITSVNACLTEIKCPCFLVWGKLDQLVPEESVQYLKKLCTNSDVRLKIYDNLSHLMILSTDCHELCSDIEAFLE